jgi:hypothetical protein
LKACSTTEIGLFRFRVQRSSNVAAVLFLSR